MRRNITWLAATLVVVALLVGYQFAYAGTRSDERDSDRACPAAAGTSCEPSGADRPDGSSSAQVGKPGENK